MNRHCENDSEHNRRQCFWKISIYPDTVYSSAQSWKFVSLYEGMWAFLYNEWRTILRWFPRALVSYSNKNAWFLFNFVLWKTRLPHSTRRVPSVRPAIFSDENYEKNTFFAVFFFGQKVICDVLSIFSSFSSTIYYIEWCFSLKKPRQ